MSREAVDVPKQMGSEVQIDLSMLQHVINPIYYPLLWNESRYLNLMGGAGSGKSVFAAQKVLFRTLTEAKSRYLALRKVHATLKVSVFKLLQDVVREWGMDKAFTFNKTDLTITCLNGNEILCAGLDDPEKLKSIQGITSVWVEEATELRPNDFMQLDLRIRGKVAGYKQIMLTYNPISVKHWLKAQMFDSPAFQRTGPDGRYEHAKVSVKIPGKGPAVEFLTTRLRTTHSDNRYLDDQYRAVIENMRTTNPAMYAVYGRGEWGTLEGTVYNQPEVVPLYEWPALSVFDEPPIYGLDFGFNKPTALVQIGRIGRALYERELIYASGLQNEDLDALMLRTVRFPGVHGGKQAVIYGDPAEPDRIQWLRGKGWNIKAAHKAHNSIVAGIVFCREFNVRISEDSVNLEKEYLSYRWPEDVKNPTEFLDIVPIKENDHLMDAKRYAVYTHWGMGGATGLRLYGGRKVY